MPSVDGKDCPDIFSLGQVHKTSVSEIDVLVMILIKDILDALHISGPERQG